LSLCVLPNCAVVGNRVRIAMSSSASYGASGPSLPTLGVVADFALGLEWATVPADVQHRVEVTLADIVGCMLHGSISTATKQAYSFAELWANAGGNASTVPVGYGNAVPMPLAGFVNAVAADAFDHNEGFYEPGNHGGHIAAVVAPAVFAAASPETSGKELLGSFLVGYEISALASRVFHAQHGAAYHSSGSWAAIGTAAAAGRLLGLKKAQLIAAMQIAGWYAPFGRMMHSVAEPTPLKDSTAGGAKVAVEACLLARQGWEGCANDLCAASCEQINQLGKEWFMMKNIFKRHACCFWASAAVEAAVELCAQVPDCTQIDAAVVHTNKYGVSLSLKPMPCSNEQATYNLQVPVALALLGKARPLLSPVQEVGGWGDEDVKVMAGKITAATDPTYDERYPAEFLAHIEVKLIDGRTLRSSTHNTPVPEESELQRKVLDGAAACGVDGLAIATALNELAKSDSVASLCVALTTAST